MGRFGQGFELFFYTGDHSAPLAWDSDLRG